MPKKYELSVCKKKKKNWTTLNVQINYKENNTGFQTEDLLQQDGDFLVRESTNSPGQYVLSGMHKGRIKHLLLVDPNGVVRSFTCTQIRYQSHCYDVLQQWYSKRPNKKS